MSRIQSELHPTTQAVIAAHDAHMPKDVVWRRRGLLGRLVRPKH
jgi:hypothetical protein